MSLEFEQKGLKRADEFLELDISVFGSQTFIRLCKEFTEDDVFEYQPT